jgi:hypothetical protein
MRQIIVCLLVRDPPKLIVFDTNSGKVISVLDIANDADDIFYDSVKKRIYVSCGEGLQSDC